MIFESPDGGKTIFARKSGSTERKMLNAEAFQEMMDNYREEKRWIDILETARTNPALQKAVDNVILLYRLSKENPL